MIIIAGKWSLKNNCKSRRANERLKGDSLFQFTKMRGNTAIWKEKKH